MVRLTRFLAMVSTLPFLCLRRHCWDHTSFWALIFWLCSDLDFWFKKARSYATARHGAAKRVSIATSER